MVYKCFLVGWFVLANLSCRVQESRPIENSSESSIPQSSKREEKIEPEISEANTIVESFSNDSNIGRPKRNKILIDIIERGGVESAYRPNNLAIIKFYSIGAKKQWMLKQTLEVESHALADLDPKIEDFNNDGLRDITFVSNTAARGANVVRTLLIYDKINDTLIHIKNSEAYPNLSYNEALNCIDSWMFHAATTTVFLKLDGDMLREFASVGTGSQLVVTVIGKDGREREIRRQKMKEDDI